MFPLCKIVVDARFPVIVFSLKGTKITTNQILREREGTMKRQHLLFDTGNNGNSGGNDDSGGGDTDDTDVST